MLSRKYVPIASRVGVVRPERLDPWPDRSGQAPGLSGRLAFGNPASYNLFFFTISCTFPFNANATVYTSLRSPDLSLYISNMQYVRRASD